MADAAKLRQLMEKGCPVYYFYSTERYLVQHESAAVCRMLAENQDSETTVLDAPAPSLEAIVMAAGTISFFGTRRLVQLPNLEPTAYSDKDIDELCDILASTENAVFVLSTVLKEEKGPALPKRVQKLADTCQKLGYVAALQKPSALQLQQMIVARAAAQHTKLPDAVAKSMIERAGEDAYLLENETDKLCALSGYQTVTAAMVAQVGAAQLDAKVYDLINLVTVKNSTAACRKLQELLLLQNDPILITASLIGSYVDMYRVKLGQAARRSYAVVFKDFGYRGKAFRLKYALDAAGHYTVPQLENCLNILLELDKGLKSSPVDAEILLETSLCRLCAAGSRL